MGFEIKGADLSRGYWRLYDVSNEKSEDPQILMNDHSNVSNPYFSSKIQVDEKVAIILFVFFKPKMNVVSGEIPKISEF